MLRSYCEKNTFQTFITLGGDYEVPVEAEVSVYWGSNDSDDPTEVSCLSATVTADVFPVAFKGQELELKESQKAVIEDWYHILKL